MEEKGNAEERVTDGDSVRKDVTNLTQGEGRVHSSILVRDYETLIEAIDCLGCHFGVLSNTVGHDGKYLKPRENNHDLMRARDLLIGLRRTLQEREQDAHAQSKEGKREDELLNALRIIRDDLDEGMAQGHLPIESTHGVSARKIRNFANDASQ